MGALYLDGYDRPDLAIECLKTFLDSDRSGAGTLYDLGRAHEKKGEPERALSYFRQAAAFQDNPIRYDAEEAVRRVKEAIEQRPKA